MICKLNSTIFEIQKYCDNIVLLYYCSQGDFVKLLVQLKSDEKTFCRSCLYSGFFRNYRCWTSFPRIPSAAPPLLTYLHCTRALAPHSTSFPTRRAESRSTAPKFLHGNGPLPDGGFTSRLHGHDHHKHSGLDLKGSSEPTQPGFSLLLVFVFVSSPTSPLCGLSLLRLKVDPNRGVTLLLPARKNVFLR